jgi:hypothetical protein
MEVMIMQMNNTTTKHLKTNKIIKKECDKTIELILKQNANE